MVNIFSSSCDAVVDFNLRKLVQLSRKRDCAIKDIIMKMFWQPRGPARNNLGYGSWFDWIDQGYMIPIPRTNQLDNLANDYFNYVHVFDQATRTVVMWYFLGINGSLGQDTYLMYRKMKKTKKKEQKNFTVLNGKNDYTLEYHVVHVFRHFTGNDYNTRQKCQLEDKNIVTLLKNPFMPIKRPFPFIIQSYNPRTAKYVFHMVYIDNVKLTKKNFYNLLTILRDTLRKMEIDCVVIQSCASLNIRKVLKMIKYVFSEQNIMVKLSTVLR